MLLASFAATPAESVDSMLGAFAPVGLDDLGDASLLTRIDTKFVVPAALLPSILRASTNTYGILEIGGVRAHRYRTVYFDTADLKFYRAHHAGRATRMKVRVRTYVDVPRSFLEIKARDNHGRTSKRRVLLADGDHSPARLGELASPSSIDPSDLDATVTSSFTRITLVGPSERITLDTAIAFSAGGAASVFPSLVFAEVKQSGRATSPFLTLMREARIRDAGVSKYCLGIVSLHPDARRNRYKPLLSRLTRTERAHVALANAG